jgi:hypothetical protein
MNGPIAPYPQNIKSAPAIAIALAATLLPFATNLPIDYDRFAVLLFVPALWLGRQLIFTQTATALSRSERVALAIFGSAAVSSTLLSDRPVPALVMTASWILLSALALLCRRLSQHDHLLRIVIIGICGGTVLGCLAVWAAWKEGTGIHQFPHYGHGRLFGLHMMISSMAAFAWTSSLRAGTLERIISLICGVVCCAGMLWSGGRAPLIGAAAGTIVWLLVSAKGTRKSLVINFSIIGFGGLALSLLFYSSEPWLGWWNAFGRSANASSISELSSTRVDFWAATWHEFLRAPWLGSGPDAYRYLQPKLDGNQPHNWILQLLLDCGLIGAGSASFLIFRTIYRSFFASPTPARNSSLNLRQGVTITLIACITAGLLDGVFYHAVLLIPTALLLGMAGASQPTAQSSTRNTRPLNTSLKVALSGAILVLVIHNYLVFALLRLPVPTNPANASAQILRHFPSTTIGLERWLNTWRESKPDQTLEWTIWAQDHTDNPEIFHVYAAILLVEYGQRDAAILQLEAAKLKAHVRSRPRVDRLLNALKSAVP